MIYLDSAALVKLVQDEVESDALVAWLDQRIDTPWVSSVLLEVEAFRAVVRAEPAAVGNLRSFLDMIELVELDPGIRILAQTVKPAAIRSLDAVHLGTALSLTGITAFVTYDKRLAEAAVGAGLPVFAPGAA
ncbi:type II toxin-antitoxin system VapC family toxin [Catenulispora subtropica]|uniref:Ribonuclease VapC n=1 Tax=Catenulispora subtropica TaxID=450798 RepID=A0ABP5EQ28_9ACTN